MWGVGGVGAKKGLRLVHKLSNAAFVCRCMWQQNVHAPGKMDIVHLMTP